MITVMEKDEGIIITIENPTGYEKKLVEEAKRYEKNSAEYNDREDKINSMWAKFNAKKNGGTIPEPPKKREFSQEEISQIDEGLKTRLAEAFSGEVILSEGDVPF